MTTIRVKLPIEAGSKRCLTCRLYHAYPVHAPNHNQ
jgi:hypothetical protein